MYHFVQIQNVYVFSTSATTKFIIILHSIKHIILYDYIVPIIPYHVYNVHYVANYFRQKMATKFMYFRMLVFVRFHFCYWSFPRIFFHQYIVAFGVETLACFNDEIRVVLIIFETFLYTFGLFFLFVLSLVASSIFSQRSIIPSFCNRRRYIYRPSYAHTCVAPIFFWQAWWPQ